MRKTTSFLLIGASLLVGLLIVSCSKKEVKQVSQESQISQEAFALVDAVKNAFVKNDMEALKTYSTEEGYKNITANKKIFDSVELSFTPRWVEIENSQVLLNVAWKNKWITSGRTAEERGMAVFVLEGKPLKVAKILRANPFVYPEQ